MKRDFLEEQKLAKVFPILKLRMNNIPKIQTYFYITSHAIITFVEELSKALDTGEVIVGVYVDIRKAFDSISTSILRDKLYKIGIRANLCCPLQGYSSSRTQCVVNN